MRTKAMYIVRNKITGGCLFKKDGTIWFATKKEADAHKKKFGGRDDRVEKIVGGE